MSADDFHIETERRGSALIVSLVGSASMEHSEALHDQLLDACLKKPAVLILNLERLTFICSIGLGSLVTAYLRVSKHGGSFGLAAVGAGIRDMLQLTKLDTLLPVFPTVAAAVDSSSRA